MVEVFRTWSKFLEFWNDWYADCTIIVCKKLEIVCKEQPQFLDADYPHLDVIWSIDGETRYVVAMDDDKGHDEAREKVLSTIKDTFSKCKNRKNKRIQVSW